MINLFTKSWRATTTASKGKTHQFPPLPNATSIRVVTLRLDDQQNVFIGSYTEIDLDDLDVDLDDDPIPSFIALSYACGDPKPVSQVVFSSIRASVAIGKNLRDAILRLIRDGYSERIWIDALCINQLDIPERNQQVRLMNRLFSSAQQVLVYLGQENDTLSEALRLVRNFANPTNDMDGGVQRFVDEEGPSLPDDTAASAIAKGLCDSLRVLEFEALGSFFNRAWFRRLWVVQEVVVAKQPLVLCGEHESITYETIGRASFWLIHDQAQSMTTVRLRAASMSAFITFIFRQHYQRKGKVSLEHLNTFHGLEASEQRDRVFALLGICDIPKHIEPYLSIDYSREIRFVYQDAVIALIRSSRSLNVLYWANEDDRPSEDSPSWVPYLNHTSNQFACPVRILDHTVNIADASANTSAELLTPGRPDELRVAGIMTSKIAWLTEYSPFNVRLDFDPNFRQRTPQFIAIFLRLREASADKSTLLDKYAEVIAHSYSQNAELRKLDRTQVIVDFRACLRAWAEARLAEPTASDDLKELGWSKLQTAAHEVLAELRQNESDMQNRSRENIRRYLFAVSGKGNSSVVILEDGKIGMASRSARVGDTVCVLAGGLWPFVLHPDDTGAYWKLRGFAYVAGLMRGEAWLQPNVNVEEFGLI